ncbi:MAG: hypothetical protein KJ052_02910 [Candidatus Hydrogenedentes bacterium]|nr:hypothetical protein [Candidatus Hydrogenedentota bacterium]
MENNKPEMKVKVGAVSASVWKRTHTTKDGRKFESRQVSLDRTYKDAKGEWKSTNNYDINDVPKAILALSRAYEHIATKSDESDSEN